MSDKVFKKISVTGCATGGYDNAIKAAVGKASDSLRGLAWFEVKELRGAIRENGELEYQATVEVAFKID